MKPLIYYFSKAKAKYYTNPTEPNEHPHWFESFVLKSEYDSIQVQLGKAETAISEMNCQYPEGPNGICTKCNYIMDKTRTDIG